MAKDEFFDFCVDVNLRLRHAVGNSSSNGRQESLKIGLPCYDDFLGPLASAIGLIRMGGL